MKLGRWEYAGTYLKVPASPQELRAHQLELRAMGRDGWEMVGPPVMVTPNLQQFYFKRPCGPTIEHAANAPTDDFDFG